MIDNNGKYRACIYIRLSREDEDKKRRDDSESVKNQRVLLHKYVKENGLQLVDEYVDDGYSGSNFDRPAFKRMINDIENGLVNMVIVKDLSRLGRNNIETNEYVDRYFPKHRVRFIALFDDVDTEMNTLGNEMAPFKIVMNEYYNRITSKNIRATFKEKKEDGLFVGWKAPYGYKKSSINKNKLEIDEEASIVVRRIFELAKEGNSPSRIADILSLDNVPTPSNYANLNRGNNCNLWCARTISEMLDNETYIGNITQGRRKKIYGVKMEVRTPKSDWIIVKNTHEAIIDKVTFDQVQKIRKKVINKGRNKDDYLLRKFLRCKECGHAIGISKAKGRKQAYTMCTYYQKYSKFKLCTSHVMNYNELEKYVLDVLRDVCEKFSDKNGLVKKLREGILKNNKYNGLRNQINVLSDKLSNYNNHLDSIYLDMKREVISYEQYERIKLRLESEERDDRVKLRALEKLLLDMKESYDLEEYVNGFLSLDRVSRELLSLLIDRIEMDKDRHLDIYFNFRM